MKRVIQQVFSYAVPPVAAVFLLGVFWSRMTAAGAIASLVIGHATGEAILAWKIWCQGSGVADGLLHFTIVAGLTMLLCLAIGVIVSWLTPRPSMAHVSGMLWSREETAPWRGLADFRWQATAIVAVVGAVIWAFR